MLYRVNLPEGWEHYYDRDHVVIEANSFNDARLGVVYHVGVAVKDQGLAFREGFIGAEGYRLTPAHDYYPAWIPEGAHVAEEEVAQ